MSTIEKINKILSKQDINFKIDKANMNKTVKELGLDSLELMGAIVAIEEGFSISFDDQELTNIKTPNDLVNLVEKSLK